MNKPLRAIFCFIFPIVLLASIGNADDAKSAKQWVTWEGKQGPGTGKHIVFIAGANEYNPESGLPVLARILAEHHGFTCTVVFTINKDGEIDPNTNDNIPGLEALDKADLMVILCRFRTLPDVQMKHIVDYLESGRPVIGMRTATHSFANIKPPSAYVKYNWNNKGPEFEGGFGRQVLGETWIRHHAPNGKTSTRGVFAPGASANPIFRGIKDGEIWGTTGVYGIRLPQLENCKTLLLGQVIAGNKETGKPVEGKDAALNEPMQPIAWTRTYSLMPGKTGRVFTTTMGSAGDVQNEAFRRMIVNAAYWALGMEDQIAEKSNVDIVGNPMPFKKGIKPAEMQQ
ncbi:MAG TPA: ThuA domain-containing protein [Humisphaera sp.]|nr:ThuA domain-containing protein [Humisphaera sp.]